MLCLSELKYIAEEDDLSVWLAVRVFVITGKSGSAVVAQINASGSK